MADGLVRADADRADLRALREQLQWAHHRIRELEQEIEMPKGKGYPSRKKPKGGKR